MDETIGHNQPHPLDLAAERGREALRDYEIGLGEEQAGRDHSIAAIIRYGLALTEGRVLHTSNNQFSGWIKASGLDRVKPFADRQERAAAKQIAAWRAFDGTVPSTAFVGCPYSRPTDIMKWRRAKDWKEKVEALGPPGNTPAWRHRHSPGEIAQATERHRQELAHATVESAKATAPKVAPSDAAKSAPAPASDRVQKAADSAEVATLKKELAAQRQELWATRDALDQLAIWAATPQPKAEDRPVKFNRAWPLRIYAIRRPFKEIGDRQVIDPSPDDPAFALRKEEFEQHLVRRGEALERRFAEKEAELKKNFDAKVRAGVEARLEKEERESQKLTDKQFMAIATCFHTDKRKTMTEQQWDRTFAMFMNLRKLVVIKPKTKAKAKAAAEPASQPAPEPEPPQGEKPQGDFYATYKALRQQRE